MVGTAAAVLAPMTRYASSNLHFFGAGTDSGNLYSWRACKCVLGAVGNDFLPTVGLEQRRQPHKPTIRCRR